MKTEVSGFLKSFSRNNLRNKKPKFKNKCYNYGIKKYIITKCKNPKKESFIEKKDARNSASTRLLPIFRSNKKLSFYRINIATEIY